jgi:Kyakuja-Dileera-Zisupton transposase
MEDFPPEMRIPDKTQVDVAIPGWHINGHGITCRNNFNLSYMEGVGRTVGEDVETIWAGTNPLAPSVREMGPAARHDTLNDHWNGWNFRKIVGFRMYLALVHISPAYLYFLEGKLFNKHFHEASEMAKKQSEVFKQLSATFSPETVANWEAMVVAWNANPKAPNPYAESESR